MNRPGPVAEAFLEWVNAQKGLQSSLGVRFSGKNKKHLDKIQSAVLFFRGEITRLAASYAGVVENQKEILAAMETVRERNRRLEKQMHDMGATNAQINGNAIMTDAEWQKYLFRYGRFLYSKQWSNFPSGVLPDDFKELANHPDEQIARIGKAIWAGIQIQGETPSYPI